MPAIFDQGAFAPCPAPFNLAAHVLQHADAQPDKIALSVLGLSGAERWSYGRLSSAVRGVASGLLSAGLEPGQIVLMRLGNTVDFPLVFLGAIAAGLVPVPTSAMLTEREVAKMIVTLQPAAIVRARGVACPPEGRIFDETDIAAWCTLPPAEFAMGDPDRLAEFGLPIVPDSLADHPGPLAGVLAGLDWAVEQGATAIDYTVIVKIL